MVRTGRVLALALSAFLVTCAFGADDKPNTDGNKKAEPTLDLQTLRNEQALGFTALREDLKAMNKLTQEKLSSQEQALIKQGADLLKMQRDIEELRTQVKSLQDAPRSPRVARSIEPAPGSTGTIRMVNQLGNPVAINLENSRFFLQPGEIRTLSNRPAGNISYQVEAPGYYTGVYSRSTQLEPNQLLSILVGP